MVFLASSQVLNSPDRGGNRDTKELNALPEVSEQAENSDKVKCVFSKVTGMGRCERFLKNTVFTASLPFRV